MFQRTPLLAPTRCHPICAANPAGSPGFIRTSTRPKIALMQCVHSKLLLITSISASCLFTGYRYNGGTYVLLCTCTMRPGLPSGVISAAVNLPPQTQPVSSPSKLGRCTSPKVDQWPNAIRVLAVLRAGCSNQGIRLSGALSTPCL